MIGGKTADLTTALELLKTAVKTMFPSFKGMLYLVLYLHSNRVVISSASSKN